MASNSNSMVGSTDTLNLSAKDADLIRSEIALMESDPNSSLTENGTLACNLCDKTFNFKNGLIRHLRLTHGKEKPYECNICHRRFGYKNILMEHQNIHFGIKPYACTLCDKRFAARSNLVQHKMVHRKPLCCTICSKRFDKLDQLQRHMLAHPGGVLSCNLCSYFSTSQQDLNEHMQKNHPPQVMNTRDKISSTSSIADDTNFQKNTLPRFGVAFNVPPPSFSNNQENISASSIFVASTASSNTDVADSMKKIDNICSQLAAKPRQINSSSDSVMLPNEIKQEPQSPNIFDADTHAAPYFVAGLQIQRQAMQHQQPLHQSPSISGSDKFQLNFKNDVRSSTATPIRDSQSRNSQDGSIIHLETSPITLQHTHQSAATDSYREPADSTSNLSEFMSLIHTLTQKAKDLGTDNFPRISVTINPPRNTRDVGLQFSTKNPNTPSLRDVLSYYEAQGKIYRCQHCGILFEERGLYFLHNSLHGAQNPLECSICHKVCTDKNDFHLHFINQQHQST